MSIDEFLNAEIEEMHDVDLDRAFYILDRIPDEYNKAYYIHPTYDMEPSIDKAINKFKVYGSSEIIELLDKESRDEVLYREQEEIPIAYNTEFVKDSKNNIMALLTYPRVLDDVSYVFFGHEFHHVLKDSHRNEIKLKNRFAEVIPMFYEFMSADREEDIDISKEILNRRMNLLALDKNYYKASIKGKLQYFNSFYYSLCLYNKYKSNPVLVLRLISRVLIGEITTLDLLNILNIYDNDLNNVVDDELYKVKEYIHN